MLNCRSNSRALKFERRKEVITSLRLSNFSAFRESHSSSASRSSTWQACAEALDGIHLLTADAYARNLSPAVLGDRVAILLTIEEWQRASNRFCYRVIGRQGTPICAGFQSLICADARTGRPIPLPAPLWDAMEKMRGIEEPLASESFREKVLAGGSKVESLFGAAERNTAVHYLAEHTPVPR